MTWGNPLPWRCVFDDHAAVVRVLDDIGGLQAVATLDAAGRATGPVVAQIPEPQARPGLLDRLETGVDRLDQSLQAAIDSTARRGFGLSRGGLPEGLSASLELPDGTLGSVLNGAKDGDRRVHRTGSIGVYQRRYQARHLSRRRTEVRRDDGVVVAALRRKGWYWRAFRADEQPARYRLQVRAQLDLSDRLAIQLTAGLLGPPGRTGWLSRTFGSL